MGYTSAQQSSSSWAVLVGGQVSHALQADPVMSGTADDEFLSGYGSANGIGVVMAAIYSLGPSVAVSATAGVDVQRFSYDLVSPPSFGEVQGRTVPGRYLTEFKGVGATSFVSLNLEVLLPGSDWNPTLLAGGGGRYWVHEHSNAAEAYAAGFQPVQNREQARSQIYAEAGFGVSPFSSTNRISFLYQRTFSSEEPMQNTFVLRHVFALTSGAKGPVCPTF